MPARFVPVDHDTPLLLPPDMRDWVPADHLVHFVLDAVGLLDLSTARVNQRGTGSAQYPPGMMLGLLIYGYATGTFSSRKLEKLTYENVAVRLLCADQHPDHDSLCSFRRENRALLESSFHQVLECAARLKVWRVGEVTLALDGTKILANASRHNAVSYGHACTQMVLLEEQIQTLLAKAEAADSTPLEDGLTVPAEVARRRERLTQLRAATAVIEARAKARQQEELAAFEAHAAARAEQEKVRGQKIGGHTPKPPKEGPNAKDQFNFTDPESRIMATKDGFQQSYNAQAAVEIESRLIVCQTVTTAGNDKEQLVPTLATLSPAVASVAVVLVDSGFYSAAAVAAVEQAASAGGLAGPKVYAATRREGHGRTVAELEVHDDPPPPGPEASAQAQMQHRLATKAGRSLYRQRKQTIEPVFGIIKAALGFRRFSLRGLVKVSTEWTLVTLAYNLKRLFHLGAPLAAG
jgi:transposase